MSLIINKIKYYTIKDIVEISGVNMSTLRRWISDGDLDHWLHAYKNQSGGAVMYRLEPPCDSDTLIPGCDNVYRLPSLTESI